MAPLSCVMFIVLLMILNIFLPSNEVYLIWAYQNTNINKIVNSLKGIDCGSKKYHQDLRKLNYCQSNKKKEYNFLK
jgi:hypothetical protein